MIKGIIIDLDQTIIDSSTVKNYRDAEQWSIANSLIHEFKLYLNMVDVLNNLRLKEIKICIVTTSPRVYTKKVVEYWKIPYDYIVCSDDTVKTKPDVEPMLKGIKLLDEYPSNILSFGDRDIDIISSHMANIPAVACLWGSKNIEALLNAQPDFILNAPDEIENLIFSL